MDTRRPHHKRCILFPFAAILTVSAPGSGRAPAQDCNNNGVPDPCDIDCGPPGGTCDLPGCGMSADCNANGVPDECDIAALTTTIFSDLPISIPVGVTQDATTGDFIVTDGGNATLLRVTAGGVVTTIASGPPFSEPFGVTQDAATGDFIVIDPGNRTLFRVRPPSADCNGNGIPNDCDIASGTSLDCNANGIPDECEARVLGLDIKPGGCPNAFNRNSHGVLPVALIGAVNFDVTTVDVASVRLSRADGVGSKVAPNEGPPGPHSVFEDVATPFGGQTCDCHNLAGDGIDDLSMTFRTDAVVAALDLDGLPAGALVELVVSGCLLDGTAFRASDCLRLVPPGTAPGTLAVRSNVAGAWIDGGPSTVGGGRSIDLSATGETSALAEYVDFALADVNRDGRVDGGDIQVFVDILAAPSGAGHLQRVLADLNGDNRLDLADATQFVQVLLGPA